MKAVACQDARLEVVDLPEPEPGPGQVLLEVVRCGICGSDLHARHHADEAADILVEAGYDGFMRSTQQVVLGHEFSGRVLAYGPQTRRKLPLGTEVVALPLIRRDGEIQAVGLSASAPGAYAERVVTQEALTLALPEGLAPELAVLTEPLAIGHHAVRRAEIKKGQTAVVVGCGPVGLAVIAMLRAAGIDDIVAADLSPGRRALAAACGARIVVDPTEGSPYAALGGRDFIDTVPQAFDLALDATEKIKRLPVPWHHVWRAAERLGATPKHPIVFECVGVPGIIDSIIGAAPLFSQVVVVGVCMEPDRVRPAMAINKEIDLRFVLGYSPLEFRDTLAMLGDGKVDAARMITGTVGLAGVEGAFEALGDPEAHAKILIDPKSSASLPTA